MNDLISPEDLVSAMVEAAEIYTNEICETVEEGIVRIGKETVKEVKSLSPIYEGSSKKLHKGKYRSGWTTSVERSRGKPRITVHNEQYQLVHLLELGHLTRLGTGRKYYNDNGRKYAQPFSHVAPAEKHAEEKIDKLLEDL